ncbi:MAG: thioesterase family protein [Myxococcales bacterium]|nr:thioesterase family protein [Myxococcales bacterium]
MALHDTRTSLAARPSDLDSLGHVNHAVVLEYLEAGRWGWMDENHLARIDAIVPVTSRIEIDYRRELRCEPLVVETALLEPEDLDADLTYRATFHQRVCAVRDGAWIVAAEARVQIAFLDGRTRALAPVRNFLIAAQGAS